MVGGVAVIEEEVDGVAGGAGDGVDEAREPNLYVDFAFKLADSQVGSSINKRASTLGKLG